MRDAGVERAVLVGHSMGTPVAFTFLRLFPAKTKALVIVDGYMPQTPKDDADRAAQKARMEPFLRSFRAPDYKETARKMIESMYSDKTTPAQREEIVTKMLATPQHVMASAMEGMFALEAPKAGDTYTLPVLAIMAATSSGATRDAPFRAVFPNLKYEEWQGSGHFLMMESPERFNRALTEFLAGIEHPKQ
jgi:pimeloyl-ACP methyl ester carboxylesterase